MSTLISQQAEVIENIEDADVLARGNNNGDDVVQTSYLYPQNYGLKFRMQF